jgi:hypothetical protein
MESAWWTRFSVPMPNLRFVLGTIIGLSTIYGIYLGLHLSKSQGSVSLNTAYFAGVVASNIIKGVILAALIWVLAWALKRFRVKNPKPFVLWIGNVVYWLGSAIAVYMAALAVYAVIYAVQASDSGQGAVSAISLLIATAFSYWFVTRGIRYMLGR